MKNGEGKREREREGAGAGAGEEGGRGINGAKRVFAERNKYYKTRESSQQKLQREGTFT